MASDKSNADRIISLSSVVIALCSMILTLYSGCWTRYHNRLSVTPRMYFFEDRTEQDPQVGLLLSNNGLGPALIKSWTVSVDNQPVGSYSPGWYAAYQKLNLPPNKGLHFSSFAVLEAGKQEFVFSINQEQWKKLEPQEQEAFRAAMRRIKVVIDYDSVYNEHNQCVFDGASQW